MTSIAALFTRWTRASRLQRRLERLRIALEGCNEARRFDEAIGIARAAVDRVPNAAILGLAAGIALQCADLDRAHAWAEALARTGSDDEAHGRLIADIRARVELLARVRRAAGTPLPDRHARRAVCVLAFSRPYATNGYAVRSHGLLRALAVQGWDLGVYTRPGFPGDSEARWRQPSLPESMVVDDLTYHRLASPSRQQTPHMAYLLQAVDTFKKVLLAERPALVHAASNHMTALPALIAARELGIPFVYEVRGFWDITRASADPAFAGTSKERHMRLFEDETCRQADRLITLTGAMRDELVRRGCDRERISLVHNAVDPASAELAERDEALASALGLVRGVPVIGYVGSFVAYEGLDDLVRAAVRLEAAGQPFQMLLVGDGLARAGVMEAVAQAGLSQRVRVVGHVPPEAVPAHYALIDICVFPRKPWPVCEMVSPLKPYEAMAHAKPIVVSGTAVLQEMVDHERTGLVFEKGDIDALVGTLQRLLDDEPLRQRLGRSARIWVLRERSWGGAARRCAMTYLDAIRATSGLIPSPFGNGQAPAAIT